MRGILLVRLILATALLGGATGVRAEDEWVKTMNRQLERRKELAAQGLELNTLGRMMEIDETFRAPTTTASTDKTDYWALARKAEEYRREQLQAAREKADRAAREAAEDAAWKKAYTQRMAELDRRAVESVPARIAQVNAYLGLSQEVSREAIEKEGGNPRAAATRALIALERQDRRAFLELIAETKAWKDGRLCDWAEVFKVVGPAHGGSQSSYGAALYLELADLNKAVAGDMNRIYWSACIANDIMDNDWGVGNTPTLTPVTVRDSVDFYLSHHSRALPDELAEVFLKLPLKGVDAKYVNYAEGFIRLWESAPHIPREKVAAFREAYLSMTNTDGRMVTELDALTDRGRDLGWLCTQINQLTQPGQERTAAVLLHQAIELAVSSPPTANGPPIDLIALIERMPKQGIAPWLSYTRTADTLKALACESTQRIRVQQALSALVDRCATENFSVVQSAGPLALADLSWRLSVSDATADDDARLVQRADWAYDPESFGPVDALFSFSAERVTRLLADQAHQEAVLHAFLALEAKGSASARRLLIQALTDGPLAHLVEAPSLRAALAARVKP
ncbi:MAG: hypothetical protein RL091_1005 [Verrucomicrobiota bacterium]|jgi:hypothetical protein